MTTWQKVTPHWRATNALRHPKQSDINQLCLTSLYFKCSTSSEACPPASQILDMSSLAAEDPLALHYLYYLLYWYELQAVTLRFEHPRVSIFPRLTQETTSCYTSWSHIVHVTTSAVNKTKPMLISKSLLWLARAGKMGLPTLPTRDCRDFPANNCRSQASSVMMAGHCPRSFLTRKKKQNLANIPPPWPNTW